MMGLFPFSIPAEGKPFGQNTGTKGICFKEPKLDPPPGYLPFSPLPFRSIPTCRYLFIMASTLERMENVLKFRLVFLNIPSSLVYEPDTEYWMLSLPPRTA